MYTGKRVAVVIPAYNEQDLISDTLRSIPDYVDDVIFVDDFSHDGTVAAAQNQKVRSLTLITHDSNRGVGAAIVSGYKKAIELGCELVVVMAGDNQMDPKYLPALLDPLVCAKADYTKGNRLMNNRIRAGMPALRLFGNSILSLLTKVCSGYWDIMDPQNGYTAATKEVLETIPLDDLYPRYGYPNDMLIKLNTYGFRVADVVMPSRYGSEKSKIKIPTYIPTVASILIRGFFFRMREKYVMQALHPLIFFYLMGFVLLPLGILLGVYMLYLRIHTGGITASSTLLPIFFTITGFQSLFFGMLFDMQSTKK